MSLQKRQEERDDLRCKPSVKDSLYLGDKEH